MAVILLNHAPMLGLLLLAVIYDVRWRRLPNWLTFGLILSGLARSIILTGAIGAGHALAGMLAGVAIPLLLYAMGALGGGDVKLFAGVGAWLGAGPVLGVFVVQCVIGLFLVLGQAIAQRRTGVLFRGSALLAANIAHRGVIACAPGNGCAQSSAVDRPLPYAVPVSLATLLVLLAPVLNIF